MNTSGNAKSWRDFILLCFLTCLILISATFKSVIGVVGLAILWGLVLICFSLLTSRLNLLLLSSVFLGIGYFWLYHPLSHHLYLSNDLSEELLALYFAAIALSILIHELRLKTIRLQKKEQQTATLYEAARKLSFTNSFEEAVQLLFETLFRQGFSQIALYLKASDQVQLTLHPLSTYTPTNEEIRATGSSLVQDTTKHRVAINSDKSITCSLSGLKEKLGYIKIKEDQVPLMSNENQAFLEALIDQFATALEREILREKAQDIAFMNKTQTLYKSLLNSVSHELKTPLATITGSASALLDPVIQERKERSYVLASEILSASQRLTEVLDKLLDMSRIDSGTLQPRHEEVDVRDLLATTCQRLSFDFPEAIFSITCDTNCPHMRVDPVLLSQALFYILQNGLRYGPRQGPLSIFIKENESEILISIRDRGPGIPLELKDKIFDKFYRVSPQKTGGLGLGLSIANGFLDIHGGKISVQNHPEGGAIFTLSVPKGDLP